MSRSAALFHLILAGLSVIFDNEQCQRAARSAKQQREISSAAEDTISSFLSPFLQVKQGFIYWLSSLFLVSSLLLGCVSSFLNPCCSCLVCKNTTKCSLTIEVTGKLDQLKMMTTPQETPLHTGVCLFLHNSSKHTEGGTMWTYPHYFNLKNKQKKCFEESHLKKKKASQW